MKIKNILSVMAAALVALALTGCYEKYDDPAPMPRYDDQYFIDKGYAIQSIATVKALFENPGKELVDHLKGVLAGYDPNNSRPRVISGTSPMNSSSYGRYYLITEKFVIKGKITTNDAFGNVYNSIFIQDSDGEAIEVKIGVNGIYTKFVTGETVYVICEGLALGNYRSMLSLGLKPTMEDRSDSNEPYANKNMGLQPIVDKLVFLGEKTKLDASDIVEVDMTQAVTDAELDALRGKLVRFKGLVSSWKGGRTKEAYPNFLHKLGTNSYDSYSFLYAMDQWEAYWAEYKINKEQGLPEPTKPVMPEPQNNYLADKQPTWGFQEYKGANTRNFGSSLFTAPGYSGDADFIIRTSGYARFALQPVTPDGKTINVTAIVARYTNKEGRYPAYQITVNDVRDIVQVD